jgi:ABC-type transport system substrate-binding protein
MTPASVGTICQILRMTYESMLGRDCTGGRGRGQVERNESHPADADLRIIAAAMAMDRRTFLLSSGLSVAALPAAAPARQVKTLRYGFPVAETGFDPAQVNDLYSRTIIANIFEALYTYDYLARPVVLKPCTAAALPEVADEHRRFTIRLRPGIRFADDPAFKGVTRELTAADYVYSIKRFFDPRSKSPLYNTFERAGVLGMAELRAEAVRSGRFDYDREVAGLRALDRYTLQVRLEQPKPRFVYLLADHGLSGAVAREVVEFYGDSIMEHPVGTGPFLLSQWRRSSRMVLERNPGYREEHFDEQPAPGDLAAQAIAARLRGRRLPMVDRVEVYIVEEAQPHWLAFLNGEHDLIGGVPQEFVSTAVPNGVLAPGLARRGLRADRQVLPAIAFTYFNMDDPAVGGYSPQQVALRRALSLAWDVDEEIRLLWHGQAIVAQGPIPPLTSGHDPGWASGMNAFDRPRAKALLDTYGFVDRDGDGYRERPDGSPLVLELASAPDKRGREGQQLWKRNMDAIGIRTAFRYAQWPELLRQARAGKMMMWQLGNSATSPDGGEFLDLTYGPNKGYGNFSRFDLPAYNELHERQSTMPDGPQRDALLREEVRLLVAYAPMKVRVHQIAIGMYHPWLTGYLRHPFLRGWWKFIDVDAAAQAAGQ